MKFGDIDKLVDLGSDIAVVDSFGRLVGVVTMFPSVRQPQSFERLYRPPRPLQEVHDKWEQEAKEKLAFMEYRKLQQIL